MIWQDNTSAVGNGSALPLAQQARPKPQRGDVVLQVQHLRKNYGSLTAVADLSFDLHRGEIFGLLGPNGAGKSTAISMISTELPPSGGDALICGHSVRTESRTVRHWIGIVPDEIALYPALTAAENLRFFGQIYGVARAGLETRIDQLLHLVGMDRRRDDYVATLSGGLKRRLNIVAALVNHPRLILLDEPTVGVDPHSREKIIQLVRRLRDEGAAILYTTHHMEEAQALCDRIGIINRGVLVAAGTLQELRGSLEYTDAIEITGLPAGFDLSPVQAGGMVWRVESRDGTVRLFVKNAANSLELLQKLIGPFRQSVRVAIQPSSLEQLFLRLTSGEERD